MNRLEDGTGWILPPRCASRFTAELLWKYGMVVFREHGLDPTVKPKKIVMSIRHPVTRFCSFYRLVYARSVAKMSFDAYMMNLVDPIHGVEFSNTVFDVIESGESWLYPVPLYIYTEELASLGWKVDQFVRFEHLEEDLEVAGYPVLSHKNDKIAYEQAEEVPEHIIFDSPDHTEYLSLIHQIYERDFKEFGYE